MIGYVTIEVEGKDMDSASRHAQRLADNFINDIDTVARNSRMADRRAMSHFETNRLEDRAPSVLRSVRASPSPISRLGSVPPGYRTTSVVYSGGHIPPRYPMRPASVVQTYDRPYQYASTVRRVSATPPRLTHYTMPSNGLVTPTPDYYSQPMRYYNTRARPLYASPGMARSYGNLSTGSRQVGSKLHEMMEYKMPSADYYLQMKGSLRNLNDKMHKHKQLLDRYSGIDMQNDHECVSDRVDKKFQELVSRMPEIEGFRSRGPCRDTSRSETNLYYNSPKTTAGYGQGLMPPTGGSTSELRGRIKRLLCRSKKNPHYFRYHPEGPV